MVVVIKDAFLPVTNKAISFSFLSVLRDQQVVKGRSSLINTEQTQMKLESSADIFLLTQCGHWMEQLSD